MDRFQLWHIWIQLLFVLSPEDQREEFLENGLMIAAEDPALEVEYYALLMRTVDQLLRR